MTSLAVFSSISTQPSKFRYEVSASVSFVIPSTIQETHHRQAKPSQPASVRRAQATPDSHLLPRQIPSYPLRRGVVVWHILRPEPVHRYKAIHDEA